MGGSGSYARVSRSRRIEADGREGSGGGTATLSRPSGKHPCQVLVTPLAPDRIRLGPFTAVAALLVEDPEWSPDISPDRLAMLYNFTPTESRVALLLSQGSTVADIADWLGVAGSTVRDHLQACFAKSETRNQAQLVSRILRGVASLSA